MWNSFLKAGNVMYPLVSIGNITRVSQVPIYSILTYLSLPRLMAQDKKRVFSRPFVGVHVKEAQHCRYLFAKGLRVQLMSRLVLERSFGGHFSCLNNIRLNDLMKNLLIPEDSPEDVMIPASAIAPWRHWMS